MAFAIHIKTESSDDYIYAFDGQPNKKEIIERLKEELGEEFDYISDYHWDATYKIKFKLK
jgi:type IV secretory pathway VirD2 relaxase